jgi:hypothetical protein
MKRFSRVMAGILVAAMFVGGVGPVAAPAQTVVTTTGDSGGGSDSSSEDVAYGLLAAVIVVLLAVAWRNDFSHAEQAKAKEEPIDLAALRTSSPADEPPPSDMAGVAVTFRF